MQRTSGCKCGRSLDPVWLLNGDYLCECGREYGATVNLPELLRRVDALERRIGELERDRAT